LEGGRVDEGRRVQALQHALEAVDDRQVRGRHQVGRAVVRRSDEVVAASSDSAVGRQVKILRRLTVSDTPVTLNGPLIAKSRTCGSVVTPKPEPICESASV